MKNYRIYACIEHGYEKVADNLTNVQVVKAVGKMISNEPNMRILVVEHDFDMNSDFPVYVNIARGRDFPKFKEKVLKYDNKSH